MSKVRKTDTSSYATLPRLLAIDKTYTKLDDRIAEARRLCQTHPIAATSNSGRQEFLAKWLLDTLRTSSEARASATFWDFLRDIVESLPRWTFIDVQEPLLSALLENFPEHSLFTDLETVRPSASIDVDNAIVAQPQQLAGQKRKRSPIEQGQPRSDGQSILLQALLGVFVCFQKRALKDSLASSPRYKPERWLSFIDAEPCMTFIKHWAIGIVHALKLGHHVGGFIAALDQFWQMQDVHLADAADLFTTQCLPTLSLLLTLAKRSEWRQNLGTEHVAILERLLNQNAIKAARSASLSSKGAQTGSVTPEASSITRLEQSIRGLYEEEQKAGGLGSVSVTRPWSFLASFNLLDLALRSIALKTVVQRRHEQKWIDMLFLSLYPSSCSDTAHEQYAAVTTARMLSSVRNQKLVLSKHALDAVIAKFSAFSTEAFDSPDQSLPDTPMVALAGELLAMDPSIATDTDSPYITFVLSSMTQAGLWSAETPSSTAGFWRGQLAIPLLRNFSRSRRLLDFLSHWREQVQQLSWAIPGDRGDGDMSGPRNMSVWTDAGLRDTLVEVLEPSLTVQQIEEVIIKYMQPLESGVAGDIDESAGKIASYVVLLHAIIGSVTTDHIIDCIQPLLLRLLNSIEKNFTLLLELSVDDELATYLWSLLCRLYRRCWTRSTDPQPAQSALKSYPLKAAWSRVAKCSKHSKRELQNMLEYILLVLDLNAKDPECKDIVQTGLHKLWTDAKSWANIRVASVTDVPDGHFGKQTKSVASKHTSLLASALMQTTHLWPSLTADMVSHLSSSLASDSATSTSLIRVWSETTGTTISINQPNTATDNTQDVDKIEQMGWNELEAHMARSAQENLQSKFADDVDTQWAIAARADSLSLSGTDLDDRACYTLYLDGCRALFKRRKGLKKALTWLQERERKVYKILKREDLSTCGYRIILWLHIRAACIGDKPIDADVSKLVEKLPGHRVEVGGIPTSTYRAFACLPVEYWSTEDTDMSSHNGITQEVAESIVRRFAEECRTSDEVDCRIVRLDATTITAMLERFFRVAGYQELVAVILSLLCRDIEPEAIAALEDILCSILARLDQEQLSGVIDNLLAYGVGVDALPQKLPSRARTSAYSVLRLALTCIDRTSPLCQGVDNSHTPLLARLIRLWTTCNDSLELIELLSCITLILREKDFLVDQFSVEMLLVNVHRTVSPACPITIDSVTRPPCPSAIYSSLCTTMQATLQSHRRSLGGRAHLLIPLLSSMLGCFFTLHADSDARALRHPPWLTTPLTVTHAQRFARLLTLLCDPPQATVVRRRETSGLVDKVRKARLEVSHHVHNLLHNYVRFQLHGRLADGVKEALEPGISAVMQVLDMDSAVRKGSGRSTDSRVRALGACMSKSELALLRREWESWKAVHGAWKG